MYQFGREFGYLLYFANKFLQALSLICFVFEITHYFGIIRFSALLSFCPRCNIPTACGQTFFQRLAHLKGFSSYFPIPFPSQLFFGYNGRNILRNFCGMRNKRNLPVPACSYPLRCNIVSVHNPMLVAPIDSSFLFAVLPECRSCPCFFNSVVLLCFPRKLSSQNHIPFRRSFSCNQQNKKPIHRDIKNRRELCSRFKMMFYVSALKFKGVNVSPPITR